LVRQLVDSKLRAESQLYGTFVPILESKEERLGQLEQRLQQARFDVVKLHSISSSDDDDVHAKEQSRPEADSEELNMSLSIIS
jgi:hypothetical protein